MPHPEAKDEVQGGFLLDIIIREGTTILQLLAREDETLLIGWDSLLVLYFRLDIVDGIRRFHLKGDGLPGKGFNEDLHPSAKTEDEVECGLLLNVVVGQCTAVLQLLPGEDEALLIRGDTLLILDLCLDIVNSIRRLHLEGNGLSRQRLDKICIPPRRRRTTRIVRMELALLSR